MTFIIYQFNSWHFITLYEYKILSEDEQYVTEFAKGKFLDIHINGNIKYVLYAIDMFFVEVIWDNEKG
ncbi:hypothetical protein [Eudoraea adriatica]|uniref:hypothetical protein n=1 Tax=Eudoraea adriatica TaxID=446681 RepID=UPI000361CDF0|nr:hypothetical protein [Eudoraea adriatica]